MQDADEVLVSEWEERQIFQSKKDAISAARRLASREASRIVLHDEDGDVAAEDVPGTGFASAQ